MPRSTPRSRRLGVGLLPVVLATVALLAACGSDDGSSDDTTTTSTTEATSPSTEDTDASVDAAAVADAWSRNATEHRGEDGTEVEFDCPPGGTLGSVWGTETYTDDTSVCSAAVHVGLITVEDGGTVTILIQPGQDAYEAGEANGVISSHFGPYAGSFTFPEAPPGSGTFAVPAASWSRTASGLEPGAELELECAPDGTAGSVWGTEVYTADSSICTAAVLEGLITLDDGGTVAIQVVDGEASYSGSEANGITSQDYGPYSLSFQFSDDQPSG